MRKSASKKLTKKNIKETILLEIAWEVMNQVGGIYTVIRSKTPAVCERWDDNYCLIGPYDHKQVVAEFEPINEEDDAFYKTVKVLREMGLIVHYGHWLVTGKPRAVLFDLNSMRHKLGEVQYYLWENHGISTPSDDFLLNDVLLFGEMIRIFISELKNNNDRRIIAHFHEWMAGTAIPSLRKDNVDVKTVFTTHATLLGRYLAMNDPLFYDHLPFHDWQNEARHFNIEPQVNIERAASHGAHVFTTVSEVTAEECRYLIGRDPDYILPNGINKERFEALHEFQNLHQQYKKEIHEFTIGHFFQSYTFDLDKTMYFFTSGRYEYRNKGYDLTLEALAKLNHRLKEEGSDMTIVMFFVTKKPYHSINPEALQSRAVMEELRQTVNAIKKQIGDALFFEAASTTDFKLPALNDYIDDYWKLRYRRTIQSWKSDKLPSVVTHNLVNDGEDEVLNFLRNANLVNHEDDRVKIVYHPDFINYTNPLFGMDYGQFVRGCHLGVFPSYYEPWGYTPLECIASGVPTVTSDLAGFGDFVKKNISDKSHPGTYIIHRNGKSFEESAHELYMQMYRFLQLSRRERITLRNRTEASSVQFDWEYLLKYYEEAYNKACEL
ncbi:MAG: glycosyltransferase [Cyclobacteriaceae bacterium]